MSQKKKAGKVTTGHKAALGAFSVLGLVAGWNIVGRAERAADQTGPIAPVTLPPPPALPVAVTPWPTLPIPEERPRLDAAPLPTLVAIAPQLLAAAPEGPAAGAAGAALSLPVLDMPALAPLPTMPEYVAPPPPPPPPPQVAAAPPPPADSGGNTSSGS